MRMGLTTLKTLLSAWVVASGSPSMSSPGNEGAPKRCVLRYTTGARESADFEELDFWINNGTRGEIEYAYGTRRRTLRVRFDGAEQIDLWPGFKVRLPNGLVLHVMGDASYYLTIVGEKGYRKRFAWDRSASESCARTNEEVMKSFEEAFLAPPADNDRANVSDEPPGFTFRPVEGDDYEELRTICSALHSAMEKSREIQTCSHQQWKTQIRQQEPEEVPPRELSVLRQFYDLEGTVDRVLVFPDGSAHYVWNDSEQYPYHVVFWLVAAKTHALDVVWDFGAGTRYYGPNAKLLEKADAATWFH